MIYKVYTYDMKSKITKWGNSYGVRIPQALVRKLKLEEVEVEFVQEKKGIMMLPLKKSKALAQREFLDGIPENGEHEIIETDYPRGNEVW